MKTFTYLLLVTLFMGGCTYKNEAITLPNYKGEYAGETAKKSKTVYLRSVKDLRTDKRSIGYTLKDGRKDQPLHSDADFAGKYTNGLRYALSIAGFKTVPTESEAHLVMDVTIKHLEIIYTNKTFESNLKGRLDIEVVLKRGPEVIRLNLRPEASKWIAPSFSSKDAEPFLYTLFSDSINDITSNLTNY